MSLIFGPPLKEHCAEIASILVGEVPPKRPENVLFMSVSATENSLMCHEVHDRRIEPCGGNTHEGRPYDGLISGTGSATERNADTSSRRYTQVASRLR